MGDNTLCNNRNKYRTILKMLLETKKINLEHQDMFGKTYKNYLDENRKVNAYLGTLFHIQNQFEYYFGYAPQSIPFIAITRYQMNR